MATSLGNTCVFEGCNFFRQRLILATVSGKNVKIKKIRYKDDDPGLKEFEISFIRLLEKITNGSVIEVNETGTVVFYSPGMLMGGAVDHDCNPGRGIGYYLEALLYLAPFTKRPLKAMLKGVTNDQIDPSVDAIKLSSLPLLRKFLGTDEGLDIKITSRGAAPGGGGQVLFTCPCRQKLRPLTFTDPGQIKRIRGVAWAVRVSPAFCNRMVVAARGILNKFIPDIYIYTDHQRGVHAGKSPGYGVTLVAESNTGVFLSAEWSSNPKGSEAGNTDPETVAQQAAKLLLEEVHRGGCMDSANQSLGCMMMSLGDKDVSKVLSGPLSPYTIQFLRHIKQFLQIVFKIDIQTSEQNPDRQQLMLTCVGAGFKNLSKVTL